MIKLKDILEKFDSKAQQRFLYATNPKAAKKKASKMSKKDYKKLPDKVKQEFVAIPAPQPVNVKGSVKKMDQVDEDNPLVEPDGTIKGGPDKEDIKEFVGIIKVGFLTKFLLKYIKKNPKHLDKIKKFIGSL